MKKQVWYELIPDKVESGINRCTMGVLTCTFLVLMFVGFIKKEYYMVITFAIMCLFLGGITAALWNKCTYKWRIK